MLVADSCWQLVPNAVLTYIAAGATFGVNAV